MKPNTGQSEQSMDGSGAGGDTVRRLSTDECGRMIAHLAEHPKRDTLHPFMLRFYGWTYRVAPTVVRWVVRRTGKRRP